MSSAKGRSIGRWRLEEKLGEGATSNVWRAIDPARNITVALKVLKTDELDEQLAKRRQMRMIRESEALVRAQHDNVVKIVEIGSVGKRVFLAMEYIDGVDLAQWIKTKRSWQEVLVAYLQSARGLAAAHRAGIIHRDFKPANVMMSKEGRAIVTDFGLARSDGLESEGGALGVRLTASGIAVGTPRYMAPEQHQAQAIDARTDQFAWGVALFEALYGQHPYAPQPRTDVSPSMAYAMAAMAGRVTPPPEPEVPIPASIASAVRRAIDASPDRRFPSMDEALNTIETELTRELLSRKSRAQRRLAATLAAAAVVAAGLLGALIAALGTGSPECRLADSPVTASEALAEPVAAWSKWWSASMLEACDASRAEGAKARIACLAAERRALETLLAANTPPPAAIAATAGAMMRTRCGAPGPAFDAPPRDVAEAVDRAYRTGRPEAFLALLETLAKAEGQGVASGAITIGEDAAVSDAKERGLRRASVGRVLLAYGRRGAASQHLSAAVRDLGDEGPEAASARATYLDAEIASASADAGLGDLAAADARVAALLESLAQDPVSRARALEARAWLRGAQGAWPDAIADAREAVRLSREALGETHPFAVDALFALAMAEAGSGALELAQPKLEEVIRRREGQPGPRRAEAVFALARTMARASPERARALGAEARAAAAGSAALVASIDAFLARR